MIPVGEGDFTPERIRMRTSILCLNCLRNIAYLRATMNTFRGDFYQTILNNFVDITVLEWCKIFVEEKHGKHYWKKSVCVEAPEKFLENMLSSFGVTEDDFENYIKEFKTYRDKFVAHLDRKSEMNIPDFELAKESAIFLYQHLIDKETFASAMNIEDAPKAQEYYDKCFYDAKDKYEQFK